MPSKTLPTPTPLWPIHHTCRLVWHASHGMLVVLVLAVLVLRLATRWRVRLGAGDLDAVRLARSWTQGFLR